MKNKARNERAMSMPAWRWIKYARHVCNHRKRILVGAENEIADLHDEMFWYISGGRKH